MEIKNTLGWAKHQLGLAKQKFKDSGGKMRAIIRFHEIAILIISQCLNGLR
jgi:hypothetical protein